MSSLGITLATYPQVAVSYSQIHDFVYNLWITNQMMGKEMNDEQVQSIWESLVTTLSSDHRITPQMVGFISWRNQKEFLGRPFISKFPMT